MYDIMVINHLTPPLPLLSLSPSPLPSLPLPLSPSPLPSVDVHHGSCWRLFHTNPDGPWYFPHKAGPVTAVFLVIGWILFLVLLGWIVALALVLVFVLIVFAYILNFICTGRCEINEEEGDGGGTRGGGRE